MTLIFFSSVISPLYPLVPLFALSLSLIINYNYMTMILIPVLFYRITVFLFVILNLILHFNLILFQYLFNQEYRNQDQYQQWHIQFSNSSLLFISVVSALASLITLAFIFSSLLSFLTLVRITFLFYLNFLIIHSSNSLHLLLHLILMN